MTDPIADLLTRIRNALAVNKETVLVPFSTVKHDIAQTLLKKGYVADVKVDKKAKPQAQLNITLKYMDNKPVITSIRRISKPGRRAYTRSKDIKTVLSGHGITVISTSKGIMTGKDAKKQNLGGEIMCKVW